MKKIQIFLLSFFLLAFSISVPLSAFAFDLKTDNQIYNLKSNEKIDDDSIIAGQSIIIDGTVNGDAYLFGNEITVNGTIQGDLYAFASVVNINGEIRDNLYTAAGTINVSGTVADNSAMAGGTVILNDTSNIGRDLAIAGGVVNCNSNIGQNLLLAVGNATFNGSLQGSLFGEIEQLTIHDTAEIKGNIEYTSPQKATISNEATITGIETWTDSSKSETKNTTKTNGIASLIFWNIVKLVGLLVVGFLLIYFTPKLLISVKNNVQEKLYLSFGLGVLVLIAAPLFIILLMITLIGIPLSIIITGILLLVSYLSNIFVGYCLGNWIFKLFKKKQKKSEPYLETTIGVIILSIIFMIPLLGFLAKFVTVLVGIGATLLYISSTRKKSKKK